MANLQANVWLFRGIVVTLWEISCFTLIFVIMINVIAPLAILFLIGIVVALVAVADLAKQRKGAGTGTAIMLTICFTPLAGLLYLLCFPLKEETPEKVAEK